MSNKENIINIKFDLLKKLIYSIFINLNIPPSDAEIIANILAQADLRGIHTHGVAKISIYKKRIELGLIKTNPQLKVLKNSISTALLNGDFGLGQVTGYKAMSLAIQKAEKNGVGIVGVRNGQHIGVLAYYAMMASSKNMIGMATTNTPPSMAAPGGTKKIVGVNPFAIAVPSGIKYKFPIVLDIACSQVAKSKIIMSIRKGEKNIPENWALDSQGRPTKNAKEALNGLLLPIGGHKGYGLAVIIDIIAGIITGAAFGTEVSSNYGDLKNRQKNGLFFTAIKINNFIQSEVYKKRIDQLINEIKSSSLSPGNEEVFLPGEKEYLIAEKRYIKGIPLSNYLYKELSLISSDLGIEINEYFD